MTTHCNYEDEDFPDSDFDDAGEHLRMSPRHLLTGRILTSEPGGVSAAGSRRRLES